jgi:hypothetical protein
MARLTPIIVMVLWMLPLHAYAGVVISEIAWMGTDSSPTNEWIELSNETDLPVSLEGWILKAKDGSPTVPLSGSVPPRGYFLIERTDDESVPGVPADLIAPFGKGISNEGETLDLYDGSGTIVDTVRGGKDWKSIGGDAKTRFTPQRRGSAWVTARSTPRAPAPLPPLPVPVAPLIPKEASPLQKIAPKVEAVPKPIETPLPSTEQSSTSSSAPEEVSFLVQELVQIYGADEQSNEGSREGETLPLLGVLLLLGSSAILYLRERGKPEAERYTIIEKDADDER